MTSNDKLTEAREIEERDHRSEYIIRRAKAAQGADASMAREILEDFIQAVAERREQQSDHGHPLLTPAGITCPVDWTDMEYLADCFTLILAGIDPGKALGLVPGTRGRPEEDNRERDIKFSCEVLRLMNSRHDKTSRKARQEVAQRPEFRQRNGKILGELTTRDIFNRNRVAAEIVLKLTDAQ